MVDFISRFFFEGIRINKEKRGSNKGFYVVRGILHFFTGELGGVYLWTSSDVFWLCHVAFPQRQNVSDLSVRNQRYNSDVSNLTQNVSAFRPSVLPFLSLVQLQSFLACQLAALTSCDFDSYSVLPFTVVLRALRYPSHLRMLICFPHILTVSMHHFFCCTELVLLYAPGFMVYDYTWECFSIVYHKKCSLREWFLSSVFLM